MVGIPSNLTVQKATAKTYKKKIVQGLFIRCGPAEFADAVYSVFKREEFLE